MSKEFNQKQLDTYSTLASEIYKNIETLLKAGKTIESPEVKEQQRLLHDAEVKIEFWRTRPAKTQAKEIDDSWWQDQIPQQDDNETDDRRQQEYDEQQQKDRDAIEEANRQYWSLWDE